MALLANFSLWKALAAAVDLHTAQGALFALSQLVLVVAATVFLLAFFAWPRLLQLAMTVFLLAAASNAYFMDNYGVVIEASMIQNLVQTDVREATELLTPKMAVYMLLLGVLPSVLVWRVPLVFGRWHRTLLLQIVTLVVSLAVVFAAAGSMYKHFSIVHRQNKVLRMLVNPVAPILAVAEFSLGIAREVQTTITPIAEDARQSPAYQQKNKKSVVVFVLGETARAMNFQLNGYARATNPQLSQLPVINFPNTWSCGTATAESVPCMFSMLKRTHYSASKAKSQESLLDVLHRAGVAVLWRDNNSSCKGACDRVGSEDLRRQKDPQLCSTGECFDEILLSGLQEKIDNAQSDMFIVLHQKGSHGPEYFRRSPGNMKTFLPECDRANVMDCERQSIVNAYDNTILYTDFFLSRVIDLLQKNSERYDTMMFYMSDHGESLGENNIYLHGFPYPIAPEEQRHIPFIAWFSQGFAAATGLDLDCIRSRASNEYSHDDLFHTSLGLLAVQTAVYAPEHDVFGACRKQSR